MYLELDQLTSLSLNLCNTQYILLMWDLDHIIVPLNQYISQSFDLQCL